MSGRSWVSRSDGGNASAREVKGSCVHFKGKRMRSGHSLDRGKSCLIVGVFWSWPAVCYQLIYKSMAIFEGYDPGVFHDEMFGSDGSVRPHCGPLLNRMENLSERECNIVQMVI